MPQLAAAFAADCNSALALARAGELIRSGSAPGSVAFVQLHPARLETLYEAAYLRVFISWEIFLEETMVRYLCGYSTPTWAPTFVPGITACRDLKSARTTLYGGRNYLLWHNPQDVANRGARFFTAGRHQTVMLSNLARLAWFAAVRHRIAHGQEDARQKFDQATMGVAARRYRGSRPGSFLRDTDGAAIPPHAWLDTIGSELQGLAAQIVA